MVARHEQAPAGAAGDGDGEIGGLDGLDAAEEEQGSVVRHGRREVDSRRVDEVGHGGPFAPAGAALAGDELAAAGEAQRAGARQAEGAAYLRSGYVALVGHDLRQARGQDAEQVGQAGEAVDDVGTEAPSGGGEGEGVARGVERRAHVLARPGEEGVGGAGGARLGDEADDVAARAQFADQRVHDALDAAVAGGGNGEHGVGGEE